MASHKNKLSKVVVFTVLVLGLSLWVGLAVVLQDEDRLDFEPNVACLKGSPHGKVIALAMQGPIGLYFHQGESHETAEALDDEHDHVERDDGRSVEHAPGCGCGAHEEEVDDGETGSFLTPSPLHLRAKDQIKKMQAYAHRRTEGQPISAAHEHYLQSVIEDKLKLAYELDPSNYMNYGNYHLFLATSTYGKSDYDDDAAVALARRTLEFCKKDEVDPASWLTAASASYNIITHIGRYYKKYSNSEAKASLSEFDYCLKKYENLLDESNEKGFIVSQERLAEMKERAKFLTKLREAQGVYMKRMMSHPNDK